MWRAHAAASQPARLRRQEARTHASRTQPPCHSDRLPEAPLDGDPLYGQLAAPKARQDVDYIRM